MQLLRTKKIYNYKERAKVTLTKEVCSDRWIIECVEPLGENKNLPWEEKMELGNEIASHVERMVIT